MKIKKVSAKSSFSLMLLFSILAFSSCEKESTLNVENPVISPSGNEIATTTTTTTTTSFNIASALPVGYVKDGTVDYTRVIQSALDKYSNIVFPGFPILINDTGLRVRSNKVITFSPGSELRLNPTSKSSYNIIKLERATNVVLNNPVVIGDRYKHLGTSGEGGVGIGIYSSSNITINNARVSDCWGDGIYLGRYNDYIPNENIVLSNVNVKNSRRSGLTIVSADGVKILNSYVGFSNGVSPMNGINIEPHNPKDEVQNVSIVDTKTEENRGKGIGIGFSDLYGGVNKLVSVEVIRHKDVKSGYGIRASCYKTRRLAAETITGTVKLYDCQWERNPDRALKIQSQEYENLQFEIKNPQIVDVAGNSLTEKAVKLFLALEDTINRGANRLLIF